VICRKSANFIFCVIMRLRSRIFSLWRQTLSMIAGMAAAVSPSVPVEMDDFSHALASNLPDRRPARSFSMAIGGRWCGAIDRGGTGDDVGRH
jgi:hypothetical protein